MEKARTAQQAAEAVVIKKKAEEKATNDRVKNPPSGATETSNATAKEDLDKKQAELGQAEADLKNAETLCKLRKTTYDDAVTLRQQVETQKDSALANANAATSTSGQFSTPTQRVELSKEATIAIANSIQNMVQSVLTKDYSSDACMSYLTQPDSARDAEITKFCKELVTATAMVAQQHLNTQKAILQAEFEKDDNTSTLTNCLNDPQKIVKLDEWLKKNNYSSVPKTIFFYGKEFNKARKDAVKSGVCQ